MNDNAPYLIPSLISLNIQGTLYNNEHRSVGKTIVNNLKVSEIIPTLGCSYSLGLMHESKIPDDGMSSIG